MDNITHSLIGIAAGEAAFQFKLRKNPEKKTTPSGHVLRGVFWLASWMANNFPDLDVFYTGITKGRLGSLLHHRGHTHTFTAGFFEAILVTLFVYAVTRKRRNHIILEKNVWPSVFAVSCLGIFLHIFADYWNSYGVHPFWPFYNGWFYGDSIFILEPLIWAVLIPALFQLKLNVKLANISNKVFLLAAFSIAAILILTTGYVTLGSGLCFFAITFFSFKKHSKLKQPQIALHALKSLAVLILLFFCFSTIARHKIMASLPTKADDIALSPAPMNLFCWTYFARSIEGKDKPEYVIRSGVVSFNEKLYPSSNCPNFRAKESTSLTNGEYRADFEAFKKLVSEDCEASAMMQFLRMPFVVKTDATHAIIGDARFDREKGLGFSEIAITLDRNKNCPKNLSNWNPPCTF